jgi:uncharacterized protein (TIGR03435 family)
MRRIGVSTAGTRLTADATMVVGLIMFAYNARNDQVVRNDSLLPVADIFYDISAKAEGETAPTRDQFRQMMQTLLADRFKLKLHREKKEIPV